VRWGGACRAGSTAVRAWRFTSAALASGDDCRPSARLSTAAFSAPSPSLRLLSAFSLPCPPAKPATPRPQPPPPYLERRRVQLPRHDVDVQRLHGGRAVVSDLHASGRAVSAEAVSAARVWSARGGFKGRSGEGSVKGRSGEGSFKGRSGEDFLRVKDSLSHLARAAGGVCGTTGGRGRLLAVCNTVPGT
jgi:hypothetical protein